MASAMFQITLFHSLRLSLLRGLPGNSEDSCLLRCQDLSSVPSRLPLLTPSRLGGLECPGGLAFWARGGGSGATHPSHQVACPEPGSPSLAGLMTGSSWGSDAGSGGDSRGTVPPSCVAPQVWLSSRCTHGPFSVHCGVTDQLGHRALGRTGSPLVGAELANASGI